MATVSILTSLQPGSDGSQAALVVSWVVFGLLAVFTVLFHVLVQNKNSAGKKLGYILLTATLVCLLCSLLLQFNFNKQDVNTPLSTEPPQTTEQTQAEEVDP